MLDFTSATETMPSSLLTPARNEHQNGDPHRPAYHFLPPANWMNDPNGLIYWNKQYHLFYQYNPNGPFWGTIHWGHAVSDDLLHWRDLPIALAPTLDGVDSDGCWSGCAIDNEGVPTLVYTGVRGEAQLPCIATSSDDLYTWDKYADNPVLPDLPPGLDLVAFRDPALWREGQTWYMLVGSGFKEVGGTALLFRSTNLTDWTYLHPLHIGNINRTEPTWTGSLWECPQLLALGDKHLFTFGVSHERPLYSVGQVGTYFNQRFIPESEAKLDFGDDYFYAPQTLIDATGRAIMWSWVQEGRSEASQQAAGWAGLMSLPRILSIRSDGNLEMVPAPELIALRGSHHHFEQLDLAPHSVYKLEGVRGDCLEIVAEIDLQAQTRFALAVRCAPDGEEQTLIIYDRKREWLEIDTTHSSTDTEVKHEKRGGPLAPEANERVRLHIFIDRSVIEVFANNQAAITSRMYPTRPDSLGVSLIVQGSSGLNVRSLDVWELGSIW